MNTTMADGAEQRLDAQIAEALFGQPGMSKMDVANRVRELRGEGPALLVGGRTTRDGLNVRALLATATRRAIEFAFSDQPSPGGQADELDLDRVLSLADVHAEESREDGVRLLDRGGLLAFARDVTAALAARSPVRIYGCCAQPEGELHTAECPNMRHLAARQPVGQEPLAWLVHWSDMPLESPEVTRSASRISEVSALTNPPRIVPLYAAPPAQAVDLGDFKALYRAYVRLLESGRDRIIDLGGTCDPVDVMETNDVDLRAARRVIDGKAVGNG